MRRLYYLYRRRLLVVVFVVAAPTLPAVPLPLGMSIRHDGRRVAGAGVVEEDLLIPYSFQGAGFSVSGVIQNKGRALC